ncbi:MAG TPA: DUF1801 domain-containing protein [Bacteroidales bacterium]|nr:DUF1801 domain-containing protein [Bacteroidales bacterium]
MTNSVDQYIAAQTNEAQALLERVRGLVKGLAADAEETISYGMPAFKLNGRILLYYAAHSRHIGLYPSGSGILRFSARFDALGLKWSKGAVQLPLERPIPEDLVSELILFRAEENRMKPTPGRKPRRTG